MQPLLVACPLLGFAQAKQLPNVAHLKYVTVQIKRPQGWQVVR